MERAKNAKKIRELSWEWEKKRPGDQREKCLVIKKSQESSGNLKQKQGLRRKLKTTPKPFSFSSLSH